MGGCSLWVFNIAYLAAGRKSNLKNEHTGKMTVKKQRIKKVSVLFTSSLSHLLSIYCFILSLSKNEASDNQEVKL